MRKKFKIRPVYWIGLALLVVYLLVPMFLSNPGVEYGLFSRRIFSLSPEDDIAIMLDCTPAEGWCAELTGTDREAAVDVLNGMRCWYYYLDPALIIPLGSGWERCFRLQDGDQSERYKLWEDHIRIGWLIFRVNTDPLMDLFDTVRPDGA